MRLIIGRSQGYFVQQQVSLGQLNGHVEEMFSGHTVMKAFGGETALDRRPSAASTRACTKAPGNRSSSPG